MHTLTSLTGFEALLRHRRVVVYGRPFYAGWGLTTDLAAVDRGRVLSLEELVAGALILYPRYLDPVTRLPCTPEIVIERLDDPKLWRPGLLVVARRLQGMLARRWSEVPVRCRPADAGDTMTCPADGRDCVPHGGCSDDRVGSAHPSLRLTLPLQCGPPPGRARLFPAAHPEDRRADDPGPSRRALCARRVLAVARGGVRLARERPNDLPDIDRARLISGHHIGRSLEALFSGREIRRVLLLRDPLQLQVSLYNWQMMDHLAKGWGTYSFELHLQALPRNFIAHFLLSRWLEIPWSRLMLMGDERKLGILNRMPCRFLVRRRPYRLRSPGRVDRPRPRGPAACPAAQHLGGVARADRMAAGERHTLSPASAPRFARPIASTTPCGRVGVRPGSTPQRAGRRR